MGRKIDDLYQFSAISGISIVAACHYTSVQHELGRFDHKISSDFASKIRRGRVKTVQPEKLEALERALIELAGDAGTLPVTDKDKARQMGIKKLIGRMA